jgi:hypothetical protein
MSSAKKKNNTLSIALTNGTIGFKFNLEYHLPRRSSLLLHSPSLHCCFPLRYLVDINVCRDARE